MASGVLIDSETVKAEPDVAGVAPAPPDPVPDDPESQAPNPDNGQPTNPTNGPTNGGVSERKRTANRANSAKSTGPKSKMGKRIASHNSFKHGYYSNERRLQLMAELDEDPAERERLRKDVYATYPPGSPIEEMLLDALADDFWNHARLDRFDASVKLSELQDANLEEWKREERNESYAVTYVKSEMQKGGLVRQDDSAGKFRHILGILGQQLEIAKRRAGSMLDRPQWKLLYGTNDPNRLGEDMFQKFCQGPHISDAEYVEVLGFLEEELDSYHRAWIRYKVEHQQETVASREARLVTCGGDALILFKEMEVTDRHIERKLQLLLKVRAERFAREKEESSGQSAAGSQQSAEEGGPQGESPGVNGQPPSPQEEGSRRKAEGSPQEAEGTSRFGKNGTLDLQPSTFDFSKNEATDLLENKASASAQVRNEATAESITQSAEGSRHQAAESSREAAERRHNVAQGESPGMSGQPPSPQEEGSRRKAEGNPQEAEGTSRFGKNGTLDLEPSTFDFSKNEATDLLENKASASAQIRNEATVENSRQSAEGSQQQAAESSPEAAERRHSLAQGESPGMSGHPLSSQEEGSRQSAEGSPQEAEGTSRFGKNGTFDLQPSTFDFFVRSSRTEGRCFAHRPQPMGRPPHSGRNLIPRWRGLGAGAARTRKGARRGDAARRPNEEPRWRSENQVQRHLDKARAAEGVLNKPQRSAGRAGISPGRGDARSEERILPIGSVGRWVREVRVKRHVVVGRVEARLVEEVKGIGSELEMPAVGGGEVVVDIAVRLVHRKARVGSVNDRIIAKSTSLGGDSIRFLVAVKGRAVFSLTGSEGEDES
ncbi:MAG TPA: hypothetical protein VKM93_19685 [Terriglobia bacterium]|nr:hypothetical protein [Terriglobia bacterium]